MPMTDKTLRYIGIAYLVCYIAALAIERHGFDRGPMSAGDKIFAAPILWGVAAFGIRTGSVMGRIFWVERAEKPSTFWLIVTFELLYGSFLFCWGLRDALK
jgi:hypothetical protein